MVGDLFVGYSVPKCDFVVSPLGRSVVVAGAEEQRGILALLFVELMVQDKTWSDHGRIDSLDYYRKWFMLQAIQVVTKQNVHDIRWT